MTAAIFPAKCPEELLVFSHGRLARVRQELIDHPIYPAIVDLADLQVCVQHHVFAVWDFMVFVKALQRSLACLEVPWLPVGDSTSARLINEIVLEEESAQWRAGHTSHSELYLSAMDEVGADRSTVDLLVRASAVDRNRGGRFTRRKRRPACRSLSMRHCPS